MRGNPIVLIVIVEAGIQVVFHHTSYTSGFVGTKRDDGWTTHSAALLLLSFIAFQFIRTNIAAQKHSKSILGGSIR